MHEIKVTIQFFDIALTPVKKKLITIQIVNGNKYLNASIAPTTFFVDNKQNAIYNLITK